MFNVVILGLVSFLTDVSSEMIYPLLPLYLTTQLGSISKTAATSSDVTGALRVSYRVAYLPSTWFSPYCFLENTVAPAF
jgi:hypothetical protein